MERTKSILEQGAVTRSLRDIPLFAGVPDDMLDEIAKLVTETTSKRVADSFRSVSLFEGLESDDLRRIQEISETVVAEPGEYLFREGDEGDTFFVVLRGSAELTKKTAGGGEEKLAVVRTGEAFGEMALLNDIPRSASARALESSHFLAISRESFLELLGGDSVAVRMLRNLSRALWATSVRFTAKQKSAADPRGVIRDLSRVIQRTILPTRLPTNERYQISASLRPHEKGAGGSAWDWFPLADGRLAIALMQVDGEGLPPGHYLALIRTVLREVARDYGEIGTLLRRANQALLASRVDGIDQRVDCALLALDEAEVEWGSAGRLAGAVVRSGGNSVDLPASAFPLGVREVFEFKTYRVPMMPGDFVVSFTAPPGTLLEEAKRVVLAQRSVSPAQILPDIQGLLGENVQSASAEAAAVLLKRAPDDSEEAEDGLSSVEEGSSGNGQGDGGRVTAGGGDEDRSGGGV